MKAFLSLLRAQALVFLRDKIALFFTLVFPVVFILIFGFVWGGTEGPGVTLGLVQTGEDGGLLSAVLAQQKGLGVRRYGDRAELEGTSSGAGWTWASCGTGRSSSSSRTRPGSRRATPWPRWPGASPRRPTSAARAWPRS